MIPPFFFAPLSSEIRPLTSLFTSRKQQIANETVVRHVIGIYKEKVQLVNQRLGIWKRFIRLFRSKIVFPNFKTCRMTYSGIGGGIKHGNDVIL